MASRNEFRDETVYWTQCASAEVPTDDLWLTPEEQLRLHLLKIPKRRADWRLGRWTAKSAVRALEALQGRHLSFTDIEIRVLPSGAPRAYVGPAGFNISITHRDGMGVCVVSRTELPLGCDIETVEPRDAAFICDYFTAEEQDCIRRAPDPGSAYKLVALFWSAKESVLKALQLGLRCPLTHLSVALDPPLFSGSRVRHGAFDWEVMQIHGQNHDLFQVRWTQQPPFIITAALLSPTRQAMRLKALASKPKMKRANSLA